MKSIYIVRIGQAVRHRTSYEVRGLKLAGAIVTTSLMVSHLIRGAWIEMRNAAQTRQLDQQSHLIRGAWIEMAVSTSSKNLPIDRTSYEVRGLKFDGKLSRQEILHRTSYEVRGLKYLPASSIKGPHNRTSYEVRGLK